ncbi:glycosyltransferase family 2 protein [uncultured Chloroflexus sp.]|uniref:glycosyltransferase family 2 protein n=1 Tax=uncultured Chloroflexus sp. TaxID=214040 RepID=UPI0026256FF1|nr:glycosyltransferase family 2 protein [uncultured Chloroflexus sp.]
MRVAAIVLSWNASEAVFACLASLFQQSIPVQVLVVDNASGDGTPALIAQMYPGLRLICNERNLGFAGGVNTGIRALLADPEPPEVIVLLNQDTELDERCIEHLVAPLEVDSEIAAVGAKIHYPDRTIQHAGVTLEWPRAIVRHIGWHEPDNGQYDESVECDWVTGAALALRVQALDPAQPFDEGFTPAYFEDIDLCQRLRRAGWKIVYNPAATLVHHESLSLPDELQRSCYYNRGRLRFIFKHYSIDTLLNEFIPAELAHVQQHALWPIEGHALRWAYAETLLNFSAILASRRQLDSTLTPTGEERLVAAIQDLIRAQAVAYWQNTHRRADWMFNH